jgi:hypothetical protein
MACYCGDLVEERCTSGEWCGEAARRRGGDLVGVQDAMEDLMADLGENGSVSPIGMARGIFGHSRRPRSLPLALGFDRVRWMKNHPVPDEKTIWGRGWPGF